MNLPNKLTIARVIAVPFFILAFYFGWYILAFVIFVAASLTDMLDGKIARKHNLVTNFGKIMDPLADKVLVYSALCLMIPLDAHRDPRQRIYRSGYAYRGCRRRHSYSGGHERKDQNSPPDVSCMSAASCSGFPAFHAVVVRCSGFSVGVPCYDGIFRSRIRTSEQTCIFNEITSGAFKS